MKGTLTWLILLVHGITALVVHVCDRRTFGVPNVDDCQEAMKWIPYFDTDPRAFPGGLEKRIFAEPQNLAQPFAAIGKNPNAPRAIVQLPKIWKHGKSARGIPVDGVADSSDAA